MNVVMNEHQRFIEIQGTGEEKSFDKEQLNTMLDLAQSGIEQLISLQKHHTQST